MAKISETRVREAAEDLVRVRYGETSPPKATTAGEDMRDWQLGGDRVSRAAKAGRKAAQKTISEQDIQRKINSIPMRELLGKDLTRQQLFEANDIRDDYVYKKIKLGEEVPRFISQINSAKYYLDNKDKLK